MAIDLRDYKSAGPAGSAGTHRAATHARWLAMGLLVPLVGGALAYYLFNARRESLIAAAPPIVTPAPLRTAAAPLPEVVAVPAAPAVVKYTVRPDDTLDQIFRQQQLSLQDLAAIRALPNARRNLDRLKPGEVVTFTHEEAAVQTFTRRISDTELLSVTRSGDDFKADISVTPLDTRIVQKHGVIDSSLFVSAREVGISPDVILRLANDIFGWDIDFALDIQPGDTFSLVYEQKYREGEYLGDGRILAAEFVNGGHAYRSVRFDAGDGKQGGYYTPEGRPMHKQFLRAPVDFTRISSNFTLRRFHPILNIFRAHQGVDYAAPVGTIIKAAGDGQVAFVGDKGGYGHCVILEHGHTISTLYGHMSRFAKGLRGGLHVSQGQTIGYVGQSGAATGPHLHYEYRINGVHKDPRTVPLPNAEPISPGYMAAFRASADQLLGKLDKAKDASVSVAAAH